MLYSAFQDFIAPAKRFPELWRLFVGLIVLVAVYGGTMLLFFWAADQLLAPGTALGWVSEENSNDPWGVIFFLSTFVGMVLAAFLAAGVHRRGPGSLFGPARRVISDFVAMAGLAIGVALLIGLALGSFVNLQTNLPLTVWISFVPLALVLILIQTGAEELVFRGYLQQQLAARFARPAVWLILPTAIFVAGHLDPEVQGGNMWAIMAVIGLFGLVAADLTARSGSIGAAWGLHFVNNVQAILISAVPGPLSALGLFQVPFGQDDPSILPLLALDACVLVLIWFIWVRMHRN